jgi:hypothetical protein
LHSLIVKELKYNEFHYELSSPAGRPVERARIEAVLALEQGSVGSTATKLGIARNPFIKS